MKTFFVCCRCLSLTLIESSRNFLSKLKRINRALSNEIDEMLRTLRIFVPFFSILFPILFRMIFERTLIFQFETRTSRTWCFNNTVGYAVFVSLKVRKFEFFPIIRSCLEPWNTQKFTHHVSINFKKAYSTRYIMLTCFILNASASFNIWCLSQFFGFQLHSINY